MTLTRYPGGPGRGGPENASSNVPGIPVLSPGPWRERRGAFDRDAEAYSVVSSSASYLHAAERSAAPGSFPLNPSPNTPLVGFVGQPPAPATAGDIPPQRGHDPERPGEPLEPALTFFGFWAGFMGLGLLMWFIFFAAVLRSGLIPDEAVIAGIGVAMGAALLPAYVAYLETLETSRDAGRRR
jgi:hypothetical protein